MQTALQNLADIEVRGQTIHIFLSVAQNFVPLTSKLLAKHGIPKVDPAKWYPATTFLKVCEDIRDQMGESTLFAIGKKIPERVVWPPDITTIEAVLPSIDVAYHMNHRIRGEIMFDPQTGVMKEGIGHYRCVSVEKRRAVLVCDNPYPSEFDCGIITATARKFRSAADVTLDPSQPTRSSGGASCTYIVTW